MSASSPDLPGAINAAAAALRASRRLVVLTGAGVSRESGIATFREAQEGLWARYDPMQLATPRGFRRNPKLVWDWYQFRRGLLAESRPNPAHYAVAALEDRLPQCVVVTQNIDSLHQTAGSSDVIELHGNIRRDKCFAGCQGNPTLIDIRTLEYDPDAGPPRCPHCGDYVRPDVVWFEELLPPGALERARTLCLSADVLLVIGTSGIVQPAASLPFIGAETGATVIEVNPMRTPISDIARWHLGGPAGEVMPQVLAAAWPDDPPALPGDAGEDAAGADETDET